MTMVEKVARAMYEANRWYERGALEVTSMTHGKQEWLPIAYEKLPDDERETLTKQARAAIEAMRDLSEEKLALGESFIDCEYSFGRAWRAVFNKILVSEP